METRIFRIDPDNIDKKSILQCADILKSGGTVAFPTETVYGLGANALDESAIKKIFTAKGRPSDNPLILHVHSFDEIKKYANNIPKIAGTLAHFFCPGPLSMIFEKKPMVPDSATGGLSTAAFRIPSDKIAMALIEATGLPIAAPSANLSGKPSTTDGSHVIEDLAGRVDAIIDSGRSVIGLESTVLDLTVSPIEILRPGGISFNEIKMVVPDVRKAFIHDAGNAPKSPGMKYRHYSPESPLIIVKGSISQVAARINELSADDFTTGILCSDETISLYNSNNKISAGSRSNPSEIASNIFHALRLFDKTGVSAIYSEYFNIGELEEAVMNRLIKASDKIIDTD
ncbi:MAG: threonylcarbamoyl-AMP synthase [Clostridia bacterium]|nr:threonylcarbamoyl-AMP synthase [Clostridia bacterium]MBN2882819.1 threonylcarbamoyl-AMP synthase [Clostridia bacterium]